MTEVDRRAFLRRAGAFASLAAVGISPLQALAARQGSRARVSADRGTGGYGPLLQAGPDLALPQGFRYRRFGDAGSVMSDDRTTPLAHDGMAAFPLADGKVRLIRNHELLGRVAGQAPAPGTYDPSAGGGTTTLDVDPVTRGLVTHFSSLDGTARNCAGGPTPWGTWLSCEETTAGTGLGLERPHGYVFEVPAAADGIVPALPLTSMGRFVHEAVAVDPRSGVIYETEDQSPGGFYRFVPHVAHAPGRAADLSAGGRLQMLAVDGARRANLSRGQRVGRPLSVRWVDIDDPDPSDAEANPAAVWSQGRERGGAAFSRCEGSWYGGGVVYFTCTDGGDAGEGQVWAYAPGSDPEDRGTLTLLFESPGRDVLHMPDNVCVSPRGAIVLCEDGGPLPSRQFIRALTPDGRIFDFVENLASSSEFAGATFSPDGQTLFFNLQEEPGATYAVWGPWEDGAL